MDDGKEEIKSGLKWLFSFSFYQKNYTK